MATFIGDSAMYYVLRSTNVGYVLCGPRGFLTYKIYRITTNPQLLTTKYDAAFFLFLEFLVFLGVQRRHYGLGPKCDRRGQRHITISDHHRHMHRFIGTINNNRRSPGLYPPARSKSRI